LFLLPVEVQQPLKHAFSANLANLAKRPTSNRGVHESRRDHPWNQIFAVASHIQDVYGESPSTVVETNVEKCK
jgi:hypothetical protein